MQASVKDKRRALRHKYTFLGAARDQEKAGESTCNVVVHGEAKRRRGTGNMSNPALGRHQTPEDTRQSHMERRLAHHSYRSFFCPLPHTHFHVNRPYSRWKTPEPNARTTTDGHFSVAPHRRLSLVPSHPPTVSLLSQEWDDHHGPHLTNANTSRPSYHSSQTPRGTLPSTRCTHWPTTAS